MRTSPHVLALICLAVGKAPLFTHASATHSDTEQMSPAKHKTVESITQAMTEQIEAFKSHLENLKDESGSTLTPCTRELREHFRTHHKVMRGLENDLQMIQEKDPSVPEATLLARRKQLRHLEKQLRKQSRA
ncbi:hypothetical protein F5148DRAFT_1217269, partial [Russula earlei]